MAGQQLGSIWGDLSPFLLAHLVPVRHVAGSNGGSWEQDPDADIVFGPLSDGNLDTTLQWNSPFEAIGAEAKLPLLSGLLQSGAGQSALNALGYVAESFTGDQATEVIRNFREDASKTLEKLEGATGITRLNSTQIFSGMQPLKFSVTIHFRAWKDTVNEVQKPIDQLMQWVLPQELSKVGFLESLVTTKDIVRALFPSRAPRVLAFHYADSKVSPVVIESIGQAIVSPRDSAGLRKNIGIQLTIATLAAIDRNDWTGYNIR